MVYLLSGCRTQDKAPTPEKTITAAGKTYTQTVAVINTETSTPSPTPSFTPTVTPSEVPTNTVTPAWTRVPKLPPEKAIGKLLDIYQDNGGCELPCVWGVTPGQTTWAEVRDRFAPLGDFRHGEYTQGLISHVFEAEIPVGIDPDGDGDIMMAFSTQKGKDVIEEIEAASYNISPSFDPRLVNILRKFGKPDQIWLEIIPGVVVPDQNTVEEANYDLILFYRSKGILINYWDDALIDGSKVKVCPQWNINPYREQHTPIFVIFSKNLEKDFKRFHYPTRKEGYYLLESFQQDMDTKKFTETYLDPYATTCIEVSLEMIYELEG